MNLPIIRHALGMTQAQLASEIGVSRSHLANVERGHDRLSFVAEKALRQLIGLRPPRRRKRRTRRVSRYSTWRGATPRRPLSLWKDAA